MMTELPMINNEELGRLLRSHHGLLGDIQLIAAKAGKAPVTERIGKELEAAIKRAMPPTRSNN